MNEIIKMVVGFDQRESVAYHTFVQSIIEKSSLPVSFTPLSINTLKGYEEKHEERSNDFVYSRFLTPYLNNFEGWAIFADGDMICQADIKELWDLRDESKAVLVVKHDYKTKANKKYLGNKNENYPKKNWSSLILWNCSHPKNNSAKIIHFTLGTPCFNDYKDTDFSEIWYEKYNRILEGLE